MTAKTRIRKPTQRACEVCERQEVWAESHQSWRIASTNGEYEVGDPHCIHEWDINGTFLPYE